MLLRALTPLTSAMLASAGTMPGPMSNRARLVGNTGPLSQVKRLRSGSVEMSTAEMVPILVEVEVKPERLDEFLDVMKADSEGSRTEPGCLRFDVMQDSENPCKFWFYEVYKDAAAAAAHRDFPHFKLWTDFKADGVVSSKSSKPKFTPWGFSAE
mmetsp:Transcript_364/g.742  ORF Transcript_364/g.742 Transcript_364/m.742 type:complete len:155 (+) Transcript_364:42-506(+)